MKKGKFLLLLKDVLFVAVVLLFSVSIIIFSYLYMDLFDDGFLYSYSKIIRSLVVGITVLFSVFALVFYKLSKEFLFKMTLLSLFFVSIFLACVYFLKITGVWNKINSVEKLRSFVKSFGTNATLIFIFISFTQVVFLPIPSFITVGAGVLLFGPFESAIYSLIGILIGSFLAYFIGKLFGYPVVKWLVGKENLDKGLSVIKGKDKIALTFMFLFPFFPDDVLCFVAGLTTISPRFFIIMILCTRTISVFCSCYSLNNSLIPYNTWWGILIWTLFFCFTIFMFVLIYKNGGSIEQTFKKWKSSVKHK